ncbi:MAG: hypothetical protein IK026_06230 [Eubacteriaceae bacterium]|nr:hypothetical protein [Eubacteriaceae bacterium]
MDLNKIRNTGENIYSKALIYLGWVVIACGIFDSFWLVVYFSSIRATGGTVIMVFLVCLGATAMSGLSFFGLAEVITILHDSRRLLAEMVQNNNVEDGSAGNIDEELPDL